MALQKGKPPMVREAQEGLSDKDETGRIIANGRTVSSPISVLGALTGGK